MRVIEDGQRWSKALRQSMEIKERWKFLKAHLPSSPGQMYRKSEQLIMGLVRKSGEMIKHSGELIRNSGSWMAGEEMFRDSERRSKTQGLSLWYPGSFFNFISVLLSGFIFGFIIWLMIWIPVTETLGWELMDWNRIVAKAEPVADPVCWHCKLAFVILMVMNTIVSSCFCVTSISRRIQYYIM